MKRIFSIAPMRILEKSRDTGLGGIGRWTRASGVLSVAEPVEVNTPDARAVTRASPVLSVRWSEEEEPTTLDAGEHPVAHVR